MPLPFRDWPAINALALHLKKAPKSVEQMMHLMGRSQRTIYRWLAILERSGFDVVRRTDPRTGCVVFSVLRFPDKNE